MKLILDKVKTSWHAIKHFLRAGVSLLSTVISFMQ